MKKKLLLFLALFLLGFGTSQTINLLRFPSKSVTKKPVEITHEATSTSVLGMDSQEEVVNVTRVIDGDTIEVFGSKRVRYIGIDTPETVDPRRPVECFGRKAKEVNTRLVEGKTVRLEKDISQSDKYGRLLRYVWVDGKMINDILIRLGFAYATTYPPDVKYQELFREAQREAQENKRGLWAGCPTTNTTPEVRLPQASGLQPGALEGRDFGAGQSDATNGSGDVQGLSSCTIKGNISSSGEKIYHLLGCGSYDKTVIDESIGERWFCTQEEAVNAGWRKAKNC